jgi:hypothetical protein
MNFKNVFSEIEKVDPEVYNRFDSRRSAMKEFTRFGGKLALTAVPVVLGSIFKKAYAGAKGTNEAVIEVLKYALTLEYLEAAFYVKALAEAPIPAGAAKAAIQVISSHEAAHVEVLKGTISSMGTAVPASPRFDFTARGTFANVFTDYNTFLAVAQTLEDTGVRAYKGRAAELVKGGDMLTAALNIHSVEARHASKIRQMRKAAGVDIKPWVTNEISGVGSTAVNKSYAGEGNTKQSTIEIVNINGQSISAQAASEAFDEGLTKEQVLEIVTPFIA